MVNCKLDETEYIIEPDREEVMLFILHWESPKTPRLFP